MKRIHRKLTLNRDHVRQLTDRELEEGAGATSNTYTSSNVMVTCTVGDKLGKTFTICRGGSC
jgi:hypothetical protein